ncbi:MAG: transketolase C-terminal domain-containing protein, partial [Thermoplasmatota archaeon]
GSDHPHGFTFDEEGRLAFITGEGNGALQVVDLRTINPWDRKTVLASVRKTGRAVIVNEAPLTGGFASEVSATIAEHAIEYLEAPVKRVTGYDTPFPYTLENLYMPNANKVLAAIEETINF